MEFILNLKNSMAIHQHSRPCCRNIVCRNFPGFSISWGIAIDNDPAKWLTPILGSQRTSDSQCVAARASHKLSNSDIVTLGVIKRSTADDV